MLPTRLSLVRRPFFLLLSALVLASALVSAPVAAQTAARANATPAQLWADFNHYVLIARPDLAGAAGQALLQQVDNGQLLDIVEASDYTDYPRTLSRAANIQDLNEVARSLEQRIQLARIERSRDVKRIRQDIDLLSEGQRPYRNAVERLRAAGQYAAPHLLATLQDDTRSRQHPYVMSAMTLVGRPLVYPLSVALPDLKPVTMSQVAQVLAQIGYPQPLPYLKQILEDKRTDPDARRVVQQAYDQLLQRANISGDPSAAELFLALAQTQYEATTAGEELPGYDAAEGRGIVWEYTPATGLIAVPVPGVIFGDVRAMRSAHQALVLDPALDAALSRYLMANFRRENRLPEGEVDPSYSQNLQPAGFYARLAGPLRLHEVLAQALSDNDPQLALDAIEALAQTAGTEALVNLQTGTQPLLKALSFPDRRVRFYAAEALANARPAETFDGAYRVVPVLAEGIRQSGDRYALVLTDDQATLNDLLARAGELGYQAFGGLSLQDVRGEVSRRPGVDLIVVSKTVPAIEAIYNQTAADYKLGATPILAVVSAGQQYELRDRLGAQPRLSSTVAGGNADQFRAAAEQAVQSYAGKAIAAEEAEQIALTALRVLRDIAMGSNVYNITDALPALTLALEDPRPIIVQNAGQVLALIGEPAAQQALLGAALAAKADVQIALLGSLAESATYFGSLLEADQDQALLNLVKSSTGETALAAARAHGALVTLPTSNTVQLIVNP